MSGYGYRDAVLQLDAALWRKRVIVEAESAEGRAAADAHQVPIELIGVVAVRIAGYIARGEVVVSRRDTIGALCGPGQARRVAKYGIALSQALGQPVDALWEMRNGYALCSRAGLDDIAKYIHSIRPDQVDQLRGKLRIGLHHDVEVTDAMDMQPFPVVSQAFCSALPVRYSSVPSEKWKEFALLVLEAAYEATMWAAVLRAQRGASNVVLLTSLGGNAFGNEEAWIIRALRRALKLASQFAVDVKIVSYGGDEPRERTLEIILRCTPSTS
jgi:hypothetical protein